MRGSDKPQFLILETTGHRQQANLSAADDLARLAAFKASDPRPGDYVGYSRGFIVCVTGGRRVAPAHTPPPYRVGRGGTTVVADTPVVGMAGSDDVAFYGGHLVAESMTPVNAAFVVRACNAHEAMAAALRWLVEPDGPVGSDAELIAGARRRARAALGGAAPGGGIGE